MQLSKHTNHTDSIVAVGEWRAHPLAMDAWELKALWDRLQQFPTLFSDFSRGDPDALLRSIMAMDSYWLEVRKADQLEGVVYMSNIELGVDARVHPIFFNRSVGDKIDICRAMLGWAFDEFRFHRLTASMPAIFFLATRLARKIGFVEEGRRKEVFLLGGKWVDELMFGLLASDFKNVRPQQQQLG